MSTNSTEQNQQQEAAYGSWKSPITASNVASGASATSMLRVDSAQPTHVYWLESRPSEGGRLTLLRQDISQIGEEPYELTTEWNVRTGVHEYGGGAYAVYDGLVVFANWKDQGVYLLDTSKSTRVALRIGEQNDKLRYAGFAIHPSKKFVICVREDHGKSDIEAVASVVAIRLEDTGAIANDIMLFEGTDFVSSPVFSTKNDEIAFIAWNHPNMSWDETALYRAKLSFNSEMVPEPKLKDLAIVAGGAQEVMRESIYQPRFDLDGVLHFLSDRITGFWSPYHIDIQGAVVSSLRSPVLAEFTGPEWSMGDSTFQPVPGRKSSMAVTYTLNGALHLGILDTAAGAIEELPVPGWTVVSDMNMAESRSGEPVLVLKAGQPTERTAMYAYFINAINTASVPQRIGAQTASDTSLYDGYLSVPREIEFETRLPPFDGEDTKAQAYAYYYPPANKDYRGMKGERPPLLVLSHGGPTTSTNTSFSLSIQFWTSRGFAVADVNYGGSTGYGRAFRERLYPHFGQVDVQDCCAAALHLASLGLADRARLSIMGGSAGGYTTLACLAFRPEVFAVGASHYGISDLEVLVKETHKFESLYPVHLVGPYPAARTTYVERSPLHAVDALACPAIFFQGLDDKVVPPNQTSLMVDALKRKGIRVAHVEFEGEQHGFRKFQNIVRAMEAQLFFFGRILGFVPSDAIDPVPISNDLL
ncbi:Esterase lipase thioesterase active site [Coemansia sp. RSA 1646]|nr:Esterase lipase thioesterase active site [Coemansia sp. RSA 1646]KAJ2087214.1 Esterase lipase thioesterase active site [Coemansia sp. RSA 986]